MGIKGTVRRNYDGHIIHANVDTDVMVSEEPPCAARPSLAIIPPHAGVAAPTRDTRRSLSCCRYGDTEKPKELYAIIEHFCNCRRRLELFGRDNNIRRGWLTLGDELSSSNHNPERWAANFEGTIEVQNEVDDELTVLPAHLNGARTDPRNPSSPLPPPPPSFALPRRITPLRIRPLTRFPSPARRSMSPPRHDAAHRVAAAEVADAAA